MRTPILLTIPFLFGALTAQEFSKEQRQELRKIIREEIRAAVKELHGDMGTTMRRVVELQDDAPTLAEKRSAAKKPGVMLFSTDGGKPIEIRLDDVTGDGKVKSVTRQVMRMPEGHDREGTIVLQLEGAESLSHPTIRMEGAKGVLGGLELMLGDARQGKMKPAKSEDKEIRKAAKKAKAKKAKKKKSRRGENETGAVFFSADGGTFEIVEVGGPTGDSKGCCEACDAPDCCETNAKVIAEEAAPSCCETNAKVIVEEAAPAHAEKVESQHEAPAAKAKARIINLR